jgi:hypothetical protein
MDRDSNRLIFRKVDGSDSDDVSTSWSPSTEDEECFEHWWVVDAERGLVFHRDWGPASPQANRDEKVSRIVAPKLYPWAEIVQLPYVHYRCHSDGRVWVSTAIPKDARARVFAGAYNDEPWF